MLPPTKLPGALEIRERLDADGVTDAFAGVMVVDRERPVRVDRVAKWLQDDPHQLAALTRRTKALQTLRHPRLLSIIDEFRDPENYLIIAEQAPGISLDTLMRHVQQRGESLSPEVMCHFAVQLVSSVDAMHCHKPPNGYQSPILHLGIRPAAAILTDRGIFRLGRYGLLPHPAAIPTSARRGRVRDTTAFLAPEQVSTDAHVTVSTDIFSLGLTLLYMVTGEIVFDEASVLQSTLKIRACDVSSALRDVRARQPGLELILGRCLKRDPTARYQSARELQQDLRALSPRPNFAALAMQTHRFLRQAGVTPRPLHTEHMVAPRATAAPPKPQPSHASPDHVRQQSVEKTTAPPPPLAPALDVSLIPSADDTPTEIISRPAPALVMPTPRLASVEIPIPASAPDNVPARIHRPTSASHRFRYGAAATAMGLILAGLLSRAHAPSDQTATGTPLAVSRDAPGAEPNAVAPRQPAAASVTTQGPLAAGSTGRRATAAEGTASSEPRRARDAHSGSTTRQALVQPHTLQATATKTSTGEAKTWSPPARLEQTEALAASASRGELTPAQLQLLESLPPDHPDFTRARVWLYEQATNVGSLGERRAHIEALMAREENQSNPIFLLEHAAVALSDRAYRDVLRMTQQADQHWLRVPTTAAFHRRAMLHEQQAQAWQGIWENSTPRDAGALKEAIGAWTRYRAHVETRSPTLAARADAQIVSLSDLGTPPSTL